MASVLLQSFEGEALISSSKKILSPPKALRDTMIQKFSYFFIQSIKTWGLNPESLIQVGNVNNEKITTLQYSNFFLALLLLLYVPVQCSVLIPDRTGSSRSFRSFVYLEFGHMKALLWQKYRNERGKPITVSIWATVKTSIGIFCFRWLVPCECLIRYLYIW